jgi:hypothetical protein
VEEFEFVREHDLRQALPVLAAAGPRAGPLHPNAAAALGTPALYPNAAAALGTGDTARGGGTRRRPFADRAGRRVRCAGARRAPVLGRRG